MIRTFAMSESEPALQAIVESWLTDVHRGGAKLYATNKGDDMFNLSFKGRYGLLIEPIPIVRQRTHIGFP
jgi:hypothetical protein